MRFIRLGTRFAVELPADEARRRAQVYLEAAGYGTGVASTGQVEAVRGTQSFNLFAFTPRAWGVKVHVGLLPREGKLEVTTAFEVEVEGQAPSRHENDFWKEEVLGLERAVRTGEVSVERNLALARRALVNNVVAVPVLFAAWLVPVAAAVQLFVREGEPLRGWPLAAVIGSAALGFALTVAVAKAVFGVFADPKDLPWL